MISNFTPIRSKNSGNIPFALTGENLLRDAVNYDLSTDTLLVKTVSGSAEQILKVDGLLCKTGTINGSTSSVYLPEVLPSTFSLAIDFYIAHLQYMSSRVTLLKAKMYDDDNSFVYDQLELVYDDKYGFIIEATSYENGEVTKQTRSSIDAVKTSSIKIVKCQSMVYFYAKTYGSYYLIASHSTSVVTPKVVFSTANSGSGIYYGTSVLYKSIYFEDVISVKEKPVEIRSSSSTRFDGIIPPNTIGTGDIIIGYASAEEEIYPEVYTFFSINQQDTSSDSYDVAISVFTFKTNITRAELFSQSEGFTWDEDEWISEGMQNNECSIPTLWDPSTAKVPVDFLRSGFAHGDAIKLKDIKRFIVNDSESWYPVLNSGSYYVRNKRYYLFSSDSVVSTLKTLQTSDGRSKQYLLYEPKVGVPFYVSTLKIDKRTGLTINSKTFVKKGKLSGIVKNGVELDSSNSDNIDTSKYEFIVVPNNNNKYSNWRIPEIKDHEEVEEGLYKISFTLPRIPLSEYPIVFTDSEVFRSKKFVAERYGEGLYSDFMYGDGISSEGDYSINYKTGVVEVLVSHKFKYIGHATFTYDYPAHIEFNNNYIESKGVLDSDPNVEDIPTLSFVDETSDEPNQVYVIEEFPVLDYSTENYLDKDNFKLYLYDTNENKFDLSWTRVNSFKDSSQEDTVYTLNSDNGKISFGDGINGKIPSQYMKIYCSYNKSVRIEYEPSNSSGEWIGKDFNLNLNKNNLTSGFLYLSRKELIPSSIDIEFSVSEINTLGSAELIARVTDIDGESVPLAEVDFTLLGTSGGTLSSSTAITNFSGEARVTYYPSSSTEDMTLKIDLFEESDSGLGVANDSAIGSTSSELINNIIFCPEVITDEPGDIYLFGIYDLGDVYLPYDPETRTGGVYKVISYYNEESGQNEVLRPSSINNKVVIFDQSLPQPFSDTEPNYDPNLRGYSIVCTKAIQARATSETNGVITESSIATTKVKYAETQIGEWTIPIPLVNYSSSEIGRATYISINPGINSMVFTTSEDTDTITLEHGNVLSYTVDLKINGRKAVAWKIDNTGDLSKIKWDSYILPAGSEISIYYSYQKVV